MSQTLLGHTHVIESVCFGKKPTDAAAIVAAAVDRQGQGSTGNTGTAAHTTNSSLSLAEGMLKAKEAEALESYSYLISGSRDRMIKLWDPLQGVCLKTFSSHENWVRCVVFHPSMKFIVSCSDDKTIRITDIKESRCMRTISEAHSHFVSTVALSEKYPFCVSGSVDKSVCIWQCI